MIASSRTRSSARAFPITVQVNGGHESAPWSMTKSHSRPPRVQQMRIVITEPRMAESCALYLITLRSSVGMCLGRRYMSGHFPPCFRANRGRSAGATAHKQEPRLLCASTQRTDPHGNSVYDKPNRGIVGPRAVLLICDSARPTQVLVFIEQSPQGVYTRARPPSPPTPKRTTPMAKCSRFESDGIGAKQLEAQFAHPGGRGRVTRARPEKRGL